MREQKPSLEEGINGAWLIAIVATQSVSVLGALLASKLEAPQPVLCLALCMYLLGAMPYPTIITLIFYRFTFLPMTMERLTPLYWIKMGAVAISTLAGSTLLLAREALPLLGMLRPFLTGFAMLRSFLDAAKQRGPGRVVAAVESQ
jgi:tellurite resistance protein TehA-like permease